MRRQLLGPLLIGLFILALFFSPLASALPQKDLKIDFDVYLDDRKIGAHTFDVTVVDGISSVRSEANFKYTVLKIPVYRYTHNYNERWSDNCLVEIDATTDANGKRSEISGELADDGFAVENGDSQSRLPQCVMSFAYWNRSFLKQDRLINQQTGEYVDIEVEDLGVEDLKVRGKKVSARRYAINTGAAQLTIWYSDNDEWLALESVAKGGRIIRYELS